MQVQGKIDDNESLVTEMEEEVENLRIANAKMENRNDLLVRRLQPPSMSVIVLSFPHTLCAVAAQCPMHSSSFHGCNYAMVYNFAWHARDSISVARFARTGTEVLGSRCKGSAPTMCRTSI